MFLEIYKQIHWECIRRRRKKRVDQWKRWKRMWRMEEEGLRSSKNLLRVM
jgi:hypothetical protein